MYYILYTNTTITSSHNTLPPFTPSMATKQTNTNKHTAYDRDPLLWRTEHGTHSPKVPNKGEQKPQPTLGYGCVCMYIRMCISIYNFYAHRILRFIHSFTTQPCFKHHEHTHIIIQQSSTSKYIYIQARTRTHTQTSHILCAAIKPNKLLNAVSSYFSNKLIKLKPSWPCP